MPFVQFSDSTETKIVSVFACQQDSDEYPNQGEVDQNDARYLTFINPLGTKNGMLEQIKAERDRRTDNGGYKVGTKWFHSDQKSRSQQLGLVLLGANIPVGLQWKTMDGSFVTMTQQLAGQIIAAGAASDQAIFATAETHKAAMEASQDHSAYDFSAGWPKVFGE